MTLKRITHPDASNPHVTEDSWWEVSAVPMRNIPAPLTGAHGFDVAIIGGGYTGLNAALHLTKAGMNVCVCEASHIGWGASGRNGGFCANLSTKMSLPEIATQYGLDEMRKLISVKEAAIAQVRAFYAQAGFFPHTPLENAELAVAHTPYQLNQMRQKARDYRQLLNLKLKVMDKSEMSALGANSSAFYGGMIEPWGFGLHPLNYVHALGDRVIDAGATVSTHTEITSVTHENGFHVLTSEDAVIRAKILIVATNGYTAETIPDWSKGRFLPATSSILVTRPITPDEQRQQGWTTHHMAYDSRTLLHYFRLLPDGRMMFGGRGAVSGDPDEQSRFYKKLRRDFDRIFPAWTGVETAYQWSGFVCLNRKKAQFLGPINTDKTAWASLAYHGSGVAMASWSGKTVAELILGQKKLADLPRMLTAPTQKFPFASLRPQYLKLAYAKFRREDKR